MNSQYRDIVMSVEQFRVLSRSHIEEMFFSHTKNKKNNANAVLKKLVDRGYLQQVKEFTPYVYVIKGSKIKNSSQKINQFLHIADIYLQLKKHGKIKDFKVEPRYFNVDVRPDLFVHWKGSYWFIECQNTSFSNEQMRHKIKRYEKLYLSNQYKQLPFQQGEAVMPFVWIIGQGIPYDIHRRLLKVFQSEDVGSFIRQQKMNNQPIKINHQGIIKWSL